MQLLVTAHPFNLNLNIILLHDQFYHCLAETLYTVHSDSTCETFNHRLELNRFLA